MRKAIAILVALAVVVIAVAVLWTRDPAGPVSGEGDIPVAGAPADLPEMSGDAATPETGDPAPSGEPAAQEPETPADMAPEAAGVITGLVADETGALAGGVVVTARREDDAGGVDVLETRTDGGGRFRFDMLPLAEYAVNAERDGYAATDHAPLDQFTPVREVRLLLAPSLAIAGRVTDQQGRPVAGAEVSPWGGGRAWQSAAQRAAFTTVTDARGAFTVTGLVPDTYPLYVQAEGYAALYSDPVPAGADGVTLELARGLPVSGVLNEQGGGPIAGERVRLRATHAWLPERFAVTDARGAFSFDEVPEGSYEATLDSGRFVLAGSPVAFTVQPAPPTPPVELTAVPAGRITGRVVLADSGTPVNRARVRVRGEGRSSHTSEPTGPDGVWEVDGLPAGTYDVSFSDATSISRFADTSGTEVTGVEVAAGQAVRGIDLTLPLGAASVTGVVVGPDGSPVAGARVALESDTDDLRAWSFTGRDGRFAFLGAPEGVEAYLSATAPGMMLPDARVMSLNPGGNDAGTLELAGTAPPTLTGRLLAGNGEPVEGELQFISDRYNAHRRVMFLAADTTPAGAYVVDGLVPGTYQVGVAGAPSFEPLWEIEVAASPTVQTQDFQLGDDRAGSLTGVVMNTAGEVMPFLELQVMESSEAPALGRPRSVLTDWEGRFAVHGLRTGPASIHARAPGYARVRLQDVPTDGQPLEIVLEPAG